MHKLVGGERWLRVGRFGVISMVLSLVWLLPACGPASSTLPPVKELVLRSWVDDMPAELFDDFRAETGIRVVYDPYESQEEAVEDLAAGRTADLVVMDSRFIPGLIQRGLLLEIDRSKVPNYRYIATAFRGLSFDPDNRYSIPYQWGTTGIVYRADLVDKPVTRWADLWDPAYRGKVGLWKGQPREVIGLTLRMLGFSANSEDPAELAAAMEALRRLEPRPVFIETIDPYTAVPGLLDGRLVVAVGYAYDAIEGANQYEGIQYVLPVEGALLWGEHFVVPASTTHPQEALALLDFILRPAVMARIASYNYYAVAHDGAMDLLDPQIRSNPLIYPPEELLENAEIIFQISPTAEERYQAAWQDYCAWVEAGGGP